MASRGGAFDSRRRTFRGRGGPTDGNLPRSQVRRRKPHGSERVHGAACTGASTEPSNGTRGSSSRSEGGGTFDLDGEADPSLDDGQPSSSNTAGIQEQNGSAPEENEGEDGVGAAVDAEIRHLRRRVGNVRQSIQLSSEAISNPSAWERNCLNATKNCVAEWRSILLRYGPNSSLGCLLLDSDLSLETALDVFGLVQMALQSGPLSGAKPGYFKRCGGEVARTALSFLKTALSGDVVTDLHFTERQSNAVAKWISDAEKAANMNKPPSKSALKLQTKTKKKTRGK